MKRPNQQRYRNVRKTCPQHWNAATVCSFLRIYLRVELIWKDTTSLQSKLYNFINNIRSWYISKTPMVYFSYKKHIGPRREKLAQPICLEKKNDWEGLKEWLFIKWYPAYFMSVVMKSFLTLSCKYVCMLFSQINY